MDAWLLGPLVVLALGGAALVVALRSARRSARSLVELGPPLGAVGVELDALRADLRRVAARLEGHPGGAGTGTDDR